MSVHISKRLLNTEEYHKMGELGILQEKGLELINGEIINMAPIGSRHMACVNKFNRLLHSKLETSVIISVQNPVVLGSLSEPEPDIAILKNREDQYASELPGAEDILLLIEVADSSLEYDRKIKLPLYANHAIPEYWLVNLIDATIELYWQPEGKAYRFREIFGKDDLIKARSIELEFAIQEVI
jgi:Uma2 family endonuclease